jgi:hypothetical protein
MAMCPVLGTLSAQAGAEQTRTGTLPLLHPLPSSELPVAGMSRQRIPESLAAKGSPLQPQTVWSQSCVESNSDLQPEGDPRSGQKWRHFPP